MAVKESRPSVVEVDAIAEVLALGVETLRARLAEAGAFRIGPTRVGWDAVRDAVAAHLETLRSPDGGTVYVPRRPRAPGDLGAR